MAWHSRRVAYLKLMLPAVALSIVALVLLWPQLKRDEARVARGVNKTLLEDAESLRMLNARYVGLDETRRPFTVTADSATQEAGQANTMLLDHPKADMTLKTGNWVTGEARHGRYDRERHILELDEDVALFHDSGTEFHTSRARLNLTQGSAQGEQPVRGQGPNGTIDGQGFDIVERGASILFTGKSRALLTHANAGPKPAPEPPAPVPALATVGRPRTPTAKLPAAKPAAGQPDPARPAPASGSAVGPAKANLAKPRPETAAR